MNTKSKGLSGGDGGLTLKEEGINDNYFLGKSQRKDRRVNNVGDFFS